MRILIATVLQDPKCFRGRHAAAVHRLTSSTRRLCLLTRDEDKSRFHRYRRSGRLGLAGGRTTETEYDGSSRERDQNSGKGREKDGGEKTANDRSTKRTGLRGRGGRETEWKKEDLPTSCEPRTWEKGRLGACRARSINKLSSKRNIEARSLVYPSELQCLLVGDCCYVIAAQGYPMLTRSFFHPSSSYAINFIQIVAFVETFFAQWLTLRRKGSLEVKVSGLMKAHAHCQPGTVWQVLGFRFHGTVHRALLPEERIMRF